MNERYCRVYWAVMDDPKFDGIREDMRHLGAWTVLLLTADMAWPASAFVPPTIPKASLAALTSAGLVDPLSGGRFRIHGLDAERSERSESARNAAAMRWHSARNATGNAETMPSRAEQRKSRAEQEQTRERPDGRADLEAFLVITRRAPTPRQRRLLDDVLDRHDLTGPAWAADVMFKNPSDPIGAVIEADKAWRAERIAAAQAAEAPKPVPRRPKSMPTSTDQLLKDWIASKKEIA